MTEVLEGVMTRSVAETSFPFQPAAGLGNAHVQSLIASSGLRRRKVVRWSEQVRAVEQDWILDGGEDIRLHGLYSKQPDSVPQDQKRGLAVLFHGWEGGADSNYILSNSARLYRLGFDVFRLNFRDHGNTHHLNPGIFHSCLLDEVVLALADLQKRLDPPQWSLTGYSLGGNFALRVGLRAPEAGLRLNQIVSVCPVINPEHAMQSMENVQFYERYFERKWGRSLKIKMEMYSELYGDDRFLEIKSVRARTEYMATRYAGFDSADSYFEGYSVDDDRLAGLTIPATILTAADDPVCPVGDFYRLPENPLMDVRITQKGGHCGFLKNYRLESLAEDVVADTLVRWSG
jgi:predicted alpha/beta-fold hydrolase